MRLGRLRWSRFGEAPTQLFAGLLLVGFLTVRRRPIELVGAERARLTRRGRLLFGGLPAVGGLSLGQGIVDHCTFLRLFKVEVPADELLYLLNRQDLYVLKGVFPLRLLPGQGKLARAEGGASSTATATATPPSAPRAPSFRASGGIPLGIEKPVINLLYLFVQIRRNKCLESLVAAHLHLAGELNRPLQQGFVLCAQDEGELEKVGLEVREARGGKQAARVVPDEVDQILALLSAGLLARHIAHEGRPPGVPFHLGPHDLVTLEFYGLFFLFGAVDRGSIHLGVFVRKVGRVALLVPSLRLY